MRISDWSSTCALPIWTGGFANAYPHVQPFVAIDDVVAGVAANGVAAIATEDDVAGVIGGHPDTEHGLKPIDPGDTGGVEVASPISFRSADGGVGIEGRAFRRGHIGARQDIVEPRP